MSFATLLVSLRQARVVAKLVLIEHGTRREVFAFGVLVLVFAGMGWSTRTARAADDAVVALIVDLGLTLAVPFVSIFMGSSALGAWMRNRSLVHLWIRSARRWSLVFGALGGTILVALVANVVPLLVLLAVAGRASVGVVIGGLHATVWLTLVYAAMGSALSLVTRRPVVIGLLFVLVWDAPLSLMNGSLAALSVMSYGGSLLALWSGVDMDLSGRSLLPALLVPPLLSLAAACLSVFRLNRMEIV